MSSLKIMEVNMNKSLEGATLSNAEAAAYLGCTELTLRAWVSRRKVPFCRVNRLIRFRKKDLDAWLEQNHVPVVQEKP